MRLPWLSGRRLIALPQVRHMRIIVFLKIEPEPSRDTKHFFQLDRSIGGDGFIAVDDAVNRLAGQAGPFGKMGLRHLGFLKRLSKRLARQHDVIWLKFIFFHDFITSLRH